MAREQKYTPIKFRFLELADELEKCKNDLEHQVIRVRSNRLEGLERITSEVNAIGAELEELVGEIRRGEDYGSV